LATTAHRVCRPRFPNTWIITSEAPLRASACLSYGPLLRDHPAPIAAYMAGPNSYEVRKGLEIAREVLALKPEPAYATP
jgi:hypothetical protein